MPQNQGSDLGHTNDSPNVEAASNHDWFKKPERPPTPDPDWNARKSLMSTPIDFSAYVMNNLKIDNLTLEHLVGQAFNLLKGKSIPVDYFITNDLECRKCGSSSSRYTTSTTKTKADKYDDIQGIEDMVPYNRVSKNDVYSTKRIIKVRREDQQLYKLKEGNLPRLHLHDIEYMLLLLVQKKFSNLERDVLFDLGAALRMFTRHIVILHRMEDLQLGVKSYRKKLNITKPHIFRLMRSDELYKFSDETLISVRSVLHDIASNLRMEEDGVI
ncbi:hypothetical protein Tco_0975541 [Tanacetum coccineum]|uniref:Uncharacterized protein n=1 Tax=Tanacetum coccineum TaxID=301880 RepID=A0ABQ5EEP5_9ASTR